MPAIKEVSIERVAEAGSRLVRQPALDRLVVEAPLAVAARGQRVLTIMRTPGHDLELVTGLLHAEALPPATVSRSSDPASDGAERAELDDDLDDDLVHVDLDPALFAPRALASAAACGVCGRQTIADLERTSASVSGDFTVSAEILRHLPATLRRTQQLFDDTGGLHAAALATGHGELLVVREDVGRHNAVDKVVGWALGARAGSPSSRRPPAPASPPGPGATATALSSPASAASAAAPAVLPPPGQLILVVSGRLGYEIVQKAVRFGTPVVAAVSAPSSLAVELAERFGVALCGFVRGERFNIYSHGWRVV